MVILICIIADTSLREGTMRKELEKAEIEKKSKRKRRIEKCSKNTRKTSTGRAFSKD
jgi:hypothetical protein